MIVTITAKTASEYEDIQSAVPRPFDIRTPPLLAD
jgi:hypothetical protein